MKEKIKQELMRVLKKCYAKNKNDPIHGIPHIESVFEAFKLFKKGNSFLSRKDMEALEYAVVLHDLGRFSANDLEHGVESVRILNKDFKKEFPEDLPKKEWICYAIENHPKTFNFKDRSEKNFFLAYLIMLDGMDTIGTKGTIRTIHHCNVHNIGLFPKKIDKERGEKIDRALELLNNPKERTDDKNRKMKSSSTLEHLIYNYCFVEQMYDFLKDRFSPTFKKEIDNRLALSKNFIAGSLEYFLNK